ncbi:MAG: hypothetical protein N2749_04935 [Clostridia bacterium]|nr:hypothetical protein [Clostridia bacterium]
MKKIIISYSFTGNNDKLAENVSKELDIKHIRIDENKKRTIWTIFFDVIFKRTPKVNPEPYILNDYDFIIFMGPVWMGKVATPFHKYLEYLKNNPKKYAYISICGGSQDSDIKILTCLKEMCTIAPTIIVEKHINDLLTKETKIEAKDVMKYKVSESEIKQFTDIIVQRLNQL